MRGPGLRIIAGALKGRRVETPGWAGLRPTSDPITTEWPGQVVKWLQDIGML